MGHFYNRTRVIQSASTSDGRVLVFAPKSTTELSPADSGNGYVRRLVEKGLLVVMAPPKTLGVAAPVSEPPKVPEPVAVIPSPALVVEVQPPAPVVEPEQIQEQEPRRLGKKHIV